MTTLPDVVMTFEVTWVMTVDGVDIGIDLGCVIGGIGVQIVVIEVVPDVVIVEIVHFDDGAVGAG